ncbi:MAG: Glutamate racemase [bacterium ADurb.Bin429]|nr:MAG: Glutamate racemase [bacterium ADurb.Bin429]
MPDVAHPTIGVFDSGVGGLTVARAVLEHLPQARLLYLADTAHVPYGPRPLEQVRDFAVQIIAFLFQQGADAVVMGCNMSSAAGAHTVAVARFSKPVFEVIGPGSAAAWAATRSGAIGVIATQGTVNSGAYGRALCACGASAVYEQACPAFVPLVERGLSDGPEVEAAVTEYLTPLRDAGIDTLVFGCTHYPFLRAPIARFLGADVTLIDPAEFVARQVEALFGAGPADPNPARHRFFSSGDPESLRREGARFLGFPLPRVAQVDVPVEASDY